MNDYTSNPTELLSTAQVAELLGLKKNTLECWRLQGKRPLCLKIGKNVRYERSEVESFLESSKRSSTSDNGHR